MGQTGPQKYNTGQNARFTPDPNQIPSITNKFIAGNNTGRSPNGPQHKTPKIMKSQFGKPDSQTLEPNKGNSFQEEQKLDEAKP